MVDDFVPRPKPINPPEPRPISVEELRRRQALRDHERETLAEITDDPDIRRERLASLDTEDAEDAAAAARSAEVGRHGAQ